MEHTDPKPKDQDSPDGRQFILKRARHMVANTVCDPWLQAMMLDLESGTRFINVCNDALEMLKSCLVETIDRLEKGHDIAEFCDPAALPYYHAPDLLDSKHTRAALAVADLSILVVSLDPEPFTAGATGDVRRDVLSYLNGVLLDWGNELQKQWIMLRPETVDHQPATSLFTHKLPVADGEKATLGTMFKTFCHAFHIGPEQLSPYTNYAAIAFANEFPIKLWPLRQIDSTPPEAKQAGCALGQICVSFQEWYFSVGKTQMNASSVHDIRRDEKIFADLREEFHKRVRECPAGPCGANCVQDSLDTVPDSPFKDRCGTAIRHIILQR